MAPAGRQRTFELVPNATVLGQQRPGDDAQPIYSKPPMTTKQAKKLHNQKNKGPKRSKAEQRRIELMEQDRIRKEFEKEKAQARARTVREKKKAKEDKEKEERKRKGLPLVDTHPSQDTISRFISRVGRVIGAKQDSAAANTLDTVGEDSETATDAGESDTDAGGVEQDASDKENQEPVEEPRPERQAKKPRLSQPDERTAGRTSPVSSQRRPGPFISRAQELVAESFSRASSVDADDPVNQKLLDAQLTADVEQASSRSVVTGDTNERRPVAESPLHSASQSADSTVSMPSAPKELPEPCPLPPKLQAPQRSTTPVRKDPTQPKAPPARHVPSHLGNGVFKRPNSLYSPATRSRPDLKSDAFQVPRGPPKFKDPAVRSNVSAERPRFLPKHLSTAQQRRPSPGHQHPGPATTNTLPTSTQAFLFDHVDELFPSPTQEARELIGNSVLESPKPNMYLTRLSINGSKIHSEAAVCQNSFIASHTRPGEGPPDPIPSAPAAGEPFDFFDSCFLTQDLVISTQDILDIDTPSKTRPVSAAPLQPAVNQEVSILTLHTEEIGKRAADVSPAPDTVHACIQQPRSSPDESKTGSKPKDTVTCCSCRGPSGSRRSRGHRSSCPAMRNQSSPRVTQHGLDDQLIASSRPLRSSYQRHAAVVPQRSTPQSDSHNSTTAQAPKPITTPYKSPPKKRMFGSSGPGPEGLVAMERSYREAQAQKRAHEAQIRAEERLMRPPALQVEQVYLDIAEFADEFLDDDFGESTGNAVSQRPSDVVERDSRVHPLLNEKKTATLAASQETDYGDIDGGLFDFLEGDTSWLDEGLDEI